MFRRNLSTVRDWFDKGFLEGHRDAVGGQRQVTASAIVAFKEARGFPEETLDPKIWKQVLSDHRRTQPATVRHPVSLVVDLGGVIVGVSDGAWAMLGYSRPDLEGPDKHVDLKFGFTDPELGIPLAWRDMDRATYEPLPVLWRSFNKPDLRGTGWITPLRYGSDSIGGWCITFDH